MKPMLLTCAALALSACVLPPVAPGAATATTPAAATGDLDLEYQLPAGWTEQRGADSITLTFTQNVHPETDFYGTYHYQLVILPSQPLRGTLVETFHAVWSEQILPLFTTRIAPAPMR